MNGVLRIMYGIEIKRTAKRRGGRSFYINQTDVGLLFVFSDGPEADTVPGGPRPHIASQLQPLRHDTSTARFIEDEYADRADTPPDDEPDGSGMVFEQGAPPALDATPAPPPRRRAAAATGDEVEQFLDAVFDAIGGL